MRLRMRLAVWLCLSLMLWTAAAESTHKHPSKTEAASCSICLVAHSARPSINSGQARPIFASVGLLQEKDSLPKAQFDVSSLGSRGPPAV